MGKLKHVECHQTSSREFLTTMTAEDILSSVDFYLSSVGLRWDMCIVITTDGTASMTGVLRTLERAPNATWKHCFFALRGPGSKGYGTSAS